MRRINKKILLLVFASALLIKFLLTASMIGNDCDEMTLIMTALNGGNEYNLYCFPFFDIGLVLLSLLLIYINFEFINSDMNTDRGYIGFLLYRFNSLKEIYNTVIKESLHKIIIVICIYIVVMFISMIFTKIDIEIKLLVLVGIFALKSQLLFLIISLLSLYINIKINNHSSVVVKYFSLLSILFVDMILQKTSFITIGSSIGTEVLVIVLYAILLILLRYIYKRPAGDNIL